MCVSACTMVAHNERFPGRPRSIAPSRSSATRATRPARRRWRVLLSDDALARCHGQGNCTEVCPMGLAPTTSIIRLRQLATRKLLGFD
jgi:succinate dehydrogenase/fumarate reductase-like Fe-S protein